ncbi:hypothetical protein [Cryptosporangium sp. NPDC051539]|uniref:hypothetical protein n=1 Tax=Cryptosporangium sp. NPDC051539 TaxID=3363962 RepID=UPI0037A6AB59
MVLVLALSPPIAALFWFLWGLPAYPFEVPGEDQLDRLRVHLAALEQDIEDRTAKYAELQAGVDEARALVELTEVQITAVRETLERAATRRVRRAWILSGLGFLISVGINYVVNWTSGAWKPSWLP